MAGRPGQSSDRPTALPNRFDRGALHGLDGRCRVARTLRQRFQALAADLGGTDALSYGQRALAERAVFLELRLAGMEAGLADGKDVPAHEHAALVNALSAIFSKLGLHRRARRVPTPQEWLDGHDV